jgi:hypothetical protein
MVRVCGTSPVYLVHLVYLVDLVCFVYLVFLVHLVQPNKQDKPNKPNEQDRLADFFSILIDGLFLSVHESHKPLGLKQQNGP